LPARQTQHWVLMTSSFAASNQGWPRVLADRLLCERYPRHLTADKVADLLRQSGVPEPWNSPDECGALAILDLSEAMLKSERLRAQDAINELLCTLPSIISQERLWVSDAKREFGEINGRNCATESLIKLYELLPSIRPLIESKRRADWHNVAHGLFQYYQRVVDPDCGRSHDGPAVRFIRSALFELEMRHRESRAIEKAVARFWRRRPTPTKAGSDL
jgi:hypothetical protein